KGTLCFLAVVGAPTRARRKSGVVMQFSVRDVSRLFKVSEKTVYRWIEQDGLSACRIDGHYGFNRGELVEWATARHMPIPDEIFKGTDTNIAALPSLADALEA